MAYKELEIDQLTTGQLAAAYKKVDKTMSRVAGGCWEFKSNKTTNATNHRLHISNVKYIDRPADIEAVRTIDLIRHRQGFRIESHSGYEMSCHNDRCFNPAHQIRPRRGWRKNEWTPEMVEKSGLLRKHGWSTYYQRKETNDPCYRSAKDEPKYAPTVPLELPTMIKMGVVKNLFSLFRVGENLPTIAAMMAQTGLSFEELLPYGYAVSALEQRTKTQNRRDMCDAMLTGFLQGKTVREISLLNGIQPAQIHIFRGALYG